MDCDQQSCSLPKSQGVTYLAPSQLYSKPFISYRSDVYNGFIDYYGDLLFQKIESPTLQYSMYCCKISCMCNENRYLFAIVARDEAPYGFTYPLSKLKWVSFQARVSKTVYQVNEQQYLNTSSTLNPNSVIRATIKQTEEQKDKVVYTVSNFPLIIELLGTSYFHTSGTVQDALEMFSTVVYFND
jgi:hypothetical protein